MPILIVVSVVVMLVAAKLHGRELRREREAEGIEHVVFGGANPPFVMALWRAERWRFWGISVALAIASALRFRADASLVWIAALLWSPTIAFLVTGAMSWRRRIRRA